MMKNSAPGISAAKPSALPPHIVLAADRHQHRHGDPRELVRRQHLARSQDAGGERLAVAAGLLGEASEHPAALDRDTSSSEGAERLDRRLGSGATDPLHHPLPQPAEHGAPHALADVRAPEDAAIRAPME